MILAIDIGLKNLAMCVMDLDHTIHLWNTFNTLQEEEHKCTGLLKNGRLCNKKASLQYLDNTFRHYTCKTHFPKTQFTKINYKEKSVKDYLLQDIARVVLQTMNQILNDNNALFQKIDQIIIELQPKINNKMKFVSHLIFGKLVELCPHTTVRFVRAAHKLKAYQGPDLSLECKLKGAYAKRKWLSIQHTTWFLTHSILFMQHAQSKTWLDLFNASSKKDDLADCFLMCINGICGIPPKRKKKIPSSSRKN